MALKDYQKVQTIAKTVLKEIESFIKPDVSERDIALEACRLMAMHNITDTWYHNVPAFVLLGSRSCDSISGKNYIASDEKVGDTNLITIDLSPLSREVWGDCARSFYIEHGKLTKEPSMPDFKEGLSTELFLHQKMLEFVTPQTKFSELFLFGNNLIKKSGFENLDFLDNLGHSIEINPQHRRFIDSNCHVKLGNVEYFTFEPHIRKTGSNWGHKYENIYYFSNRQAIEL